jgi:hypothetical protein
MPSCMIWDRLAEETDRQWLGFCCYRNLGLQRTTSKAYKNYLSAIGKGKSALSSPLQPKRGGQITKTFSGWKRDYYWDERVRAWDAAGEDRQLQIAIAAEAHVYTERLQGYHQQIEAIGIASLQLAATGLAGTVTQLNPIAKKIMNGQELTSTETAIWERCGKPRDLLAIAQIGSELMAQATNIAGLMKSIALTAED